MSRKESFTISISNSQRGQMAASPEHLWDFEVCG